MDTEPEYKKWGVVIGTISGLVSVMVGIHALTGINVPKEILGGDGPPSTTTRIETTTTTPYVAPPAEEFETTTTTTTTTVALPDFRVHSSQFDGPCGDSWCAVSAVFRNVGGTGTGAATFYVLWPDRYEYLARCSVALATTAQGAFTRAQCTASSVPLQQYFRAYTSGVRLEVKVDG